MMKGFPGETDHHSHPFPGGEGKCVANPTSNSSILLPVGKESLRA